MREIKIAFLGLLAVAAMFLMIQLAESSVSADEDKAEEKADKQWEMPEAFISIDFPGQKKDAVGHIRVNMLDGEKGKTSGFTTYKAWLADLNATFEKLKGKKVYWYGSFDVPERDSYYRDGPDALKDTHQSYDHRMVADLNAAGFERCHFVGFKSKEASGWIRADGLATVGPTRVLSTLLLEQWPEDELVIISGTDSIVMGDLTQMVEKPNCFAIDVKKDVKKDD